MTIRDQPSQAARAATTAPRAILSAFCRMCLIIFMLGSLPSCVGGVRDRMGVVGHPGGGEICLWRADAGSVRIALDTEIVSRARRIDVSESIKVQWEGLVRAQTFKLIVNSVDSNDAGTRVIASASITARSPTSTDEPVAFWIVCVLEGDPDSLECTRAVVGDMQIDSPRIETQLGVYSWVSGGNSVIILDQNGDLIEMRAPHDSLFNASEASIHSARIVCADQVSLRLMVGGYRVREPAIPNDASRIFVDELWLIEARQAVTLDGRVMDERLDPETVFRRDPNLYSTCVNDRSWIVPFGFSDDGRFAFYHRRRDGFFATSGLVACDQESSRETVLEQFTWAVYRE